MRRVPAEWLLFPFFLLPALLAIGFCLYAREDYRSKTDRYRQSGTGALDEWWEANPGETRGIRAEFLGLWGPGGPARNRSRRPTPLFAAGWNVEVDIGESGPGPGPEPWSFSAEFPAGLTARSLASADTRYEIQLGAAPASLRAAVDQESAEFRELVRTEDLDLLRSSHLPVETKRYLLRSWGKEQDLASASRLFKVVRELEENVSGLDDSPGVRAVGSARLIASGGAWEDLLIPAGTPFEEHTLTRPVSDLVRIVYRTKPAGPDAGEEAAPLAGEWSFDFPYGNDWWRAPLFARWAAPVAAVVLVLLFVPTALFVAIHRRRRADEARVRFINELAHDLRTPLTSLRLYSEMLAEGRVPEGDRDRYVGVMARESTRVSGLLGNLLDLSRLERRTRNLESVRIALGEAAETALADFAAVFPARAEDVRVSGPDGVWVRADRTALARIIGNLLDNAGKFTAEGTPVRVSWSDLGDGRVRITVADEGPGVTDKDRSRIFRRYARGTAAADAASGTGIGLAVVRELARAMGGSVTLARTGPGAAFDVVLPGGRDD